MFDRARILFDGALSPIESAARVVTNPVRDAWRGITEYDDLIAENQRLQQRVDQQVGAEIAARNVIVENQQLLALNDLESIANLPTATAQVIGQAPSNLDQLIEIDVGSDQQVAVGMAVVNEAGLVGKVHQVFQTTSLVMLVTDPRYTVPVKVLSEENPAPSTTVAGHGAERDPRRRRDDHLVDDEHDVDDLDDAARRRDGPRPTRPTRASRTRPDRRTASMTNSCSAPPPRRRRSSRPSATPVGCAAAAPIGCHGSSSSTRAPFFGEIEPGDAVYTTGGRASLAPPDIPVGIVVNEIPGSSTGWRRARGRAARPARPAPVRPGGPLQADRGARRMIVALLRSSVIRVIAVGMMLLALQNTIFADMRPAGVSLQVMLAFAAAAGAAGWLGTRRDGWFHPRADVRPRHGCTARVVVDHDGPRRLRGRVRVAHQHRASVVAGGDLRRRRRRRRRAARTGRAELHRRRQRVQQPALHDRAARRVRGRGRQPAARARQPLVPAAGHDRSGRRQPNEWRRDTRGARFCGAGLPDWAHGC